MLRANDVRGTTANSWNLTVIDNDLSASKVSGSPSIGGTPAISCSSFDGTLRYYSASSADGTSWETGRIVREAGSNTESSVLESDGLPTLAYYLDGPNNLQFSILPESVPVNWTATTGGVGESSVGMTQIATGAVGHSEMAEDAVGSREIIDGSITSADIRDRTITGADIAYNSITGAHIVTGSIPAYDIGSGTISGTSWYVYGSRAGMFNSSNVGFMRTLGANGSTNFYVSYGGTTSHGAFYLYSDNNAPQIEMRVESDDSGTMTIEGRNGTDNFRVDSTGNNNSEGRFYLYDDNQTAQVWAYSSGRYGRVFADSFTTTSDMRLKTEIEEIGDALERVRKIRGVSYRRIDVENGPREVGVLAQEIQDVLPEAVNMPEIEGIGNSSDKAPSPDSVQETPSSATSGLSSGSVFGNLSHAEVAAGRRVSGVDPAEGLIQNRGGPGAAGLQVPLESAVEPAGEYSGDDDGGLPKPEDTLHVNYNSITALLVQAVKELDGENASLRTENGKLEARLRKLEAAIEKLSAQ